MYPPIIVLKENLIDKEKIYFKMYMQDSINSKQT